MSSQVSNQSPSAEQSKAERVYDYLRGRIRELKIPPGARLSKNKIAVSCGVSRAPVSEAIARLASEGLVDVFPQSGSFVAQIRAEDIEEALFIRYGLEVEAVKQVTAEASPELIARLEGNLSQQERAMSSKPLDPVLMDDLDEAFHEIIITAIHSPRASRLLNAARAMLDRPRFLALPEHDRPYRTIVEHQRILDAIKTGDPDLAGAAMRVHIKAVADAIDEKLSQIVEQADD